MKASSQIRSGQLVSARFFAVSTAIIIFALDASNRAAVAAAPNACNATARAAATACTTGARSDYMLALGKCANIGDPVARKACQDQAKADLKDAMDTCKAQTAARLAACARLGGATYEPSIVPSNFVSTINNPLFPLIPGTTFTYTNSSGSNIVFVSHNTKLILGVDCVEVARCCISRRRLDRGYARLVRA